MNLEEGDQVVAMDVLNPVSDSATAPGYEILTVTENGYGKRTPVMEYRIQSRGGVGVINMKTTEKNGLIMGSRQVLTKDDVMLVTNKGQMIRIHVGEISEQGRNTQGVRLISMGMGEKVVSFEYMVAENAVAAVVAEVEGVEGTPEDDSSGNGIAGEPQSE
jgi:DNA gyrase subunit A